ncbi:hypothetical protein [Vaginisenegalia massiliensis]|uniref:hypothetical protein n=1 Tax=Vaginisenegalia massiliensis TaxID=2058294 RepID=UPI000F523A72|nr:hypothetical protein [Vaginisenegalia massiliensis]
MKAKENIEVYLFFFIYLLYLLPRLIMTSTIQAYLTVGSPVYWTIRLVVIGALLYKYLILHPLDIKQEWRMILVFVLVILQGLWVRNTVLFDLTMLVAASRGVSLRVIFKQYLFVVGSVTLLFFLFSLVGVIDNFAYDAGIRGVRYAFGNIYATNFAALIFMLQMIVTYLYVRRIDAIYLMSFVLTVAFVFYFTDARTTLIAMWLYTLVVAILLNTERRIPESWLKRSWLAMPIMAVASFFMSYLYRSDWLLWQILDKALSSRINLGQKALNDIGLTLLGKDFTMQGNGWNKMERLQTAVNYFVDSSYLQVGLLYGVVVLSLIIWAYVRLTKEAYRQGNWHLILLVVMLSLVSVIEHHLIDIVYNPLVFSLGALWLTPSEITETYRK